MQKPLIIFVTVSSILVLGSPLQAMQKNLLTEEEIIIRKKELSTSRVIYQDSQSNSTYTVTTGTGSMNAKSTSRSSKSSKNTFRSKLVEEALKNEGPTFTPEIVKKRAPIKLLIGIRQQNSLLIKQALIEGADLKQMYPKKGTALEYAQSLNVGPAIIQLLSPQGGFVALKGSKLEQGAEEKFDLLEE